MTMQEELKENQRRFYEATRGQKIIDAVGRSILPFSHGLDLSLLITDHKDSDISILSYPINEANKIGDLIFSLTKGNLYINSELVLVIKDVDELEEFKDSYLNFKYLILNVKGMSAPDYINYDCLIDINA